MQKHNFAIQVQLILQITWSKSYCIFILEVEKQIFIMSQVVIRSLWPILELKNNPKFTNL